MSPRTSATPDPYDVAVVGGGPAGLSGALALARSRRRVVVIDAARPRNAPAAHAHNYLTRDGAPPAEILAAGRDEVLGYGGEILRPATVTAARRRPDGSFDLDLDLDLDLRPDQGAARTLTARRLLVATGVVDELPDVPGLAEHWGSAVLHCPYCHGWEVRDQPIAVLATSRLAEHQALLWSQWSDRVTLVTHTAPAPTDEARRRLAARGVTVVEGRATGVATEADGALRGLDLADGGTVDCRAVVVAPRVTARLGALTALGLTPTEVVRDGEVLGTQLDADPLTGRTAVPGVYAAGNAASVHDHVVSAAAAGVRAGALINMDLIMDLIEADTETDTEAAPRPVPRSAR
ncbi:FAD-binding protein [Streptomyces sp. 3MP-14]|uniref:FAD-binding protein n=1 Tax=Streptomyces mimosae TaxID=2586635 RepID=A0A5N6A5Z7_9ACTN|nr:MULTISPECIES: NAD(P)/FAD-dependent oxidoreductase [Streptomyces]KAB8164224.1 FAD-binding protein [Streptomyces mimosae]KAB8176501.1 FAD-binding protein [Streptomyces sp. 3MP-14]